MHTWESPKGLSQPEDGGTRTEEVNTLTPPRSRSVVSTNVQTGAKLHEDSRRESLGEDISELRRGGDVENTDSPNSDPFADEVEVNFHVLGALVLDGVGGEVDGADVVAVDEAGGIQRVSSSYRSCRSQEASATPLATARYSASALDRETVGWRLDDQEMRLPPRKTA